MKKMVSGLVSSFMTSMLLLLGVAFFIVTERKGLSMLQLRKGPNKVSLKAIFQAIADGVKLFSKGLMVPSSSNKGLFILGSIFCFSFSYILWVVFPVSNASTFFKYSVLYFLCVSCINVYGVLVVGWSSNSQYSFIGAMRAVAQSISYEVSMGVVMFCVLLFLGSFEFSSFREESFSYFFLLVEVFFIWFLSVLAETNRAPFDFVEGESELVSGYNVEFGGISFALIALAEYSNIVFMSLITSFMFMGGFVGLTMVGDVMLGVFVFFFSFLIVWVRGAFPRFRYDKLMLFCWSVVLPASLVMFILSCVLGI